MSAYSSLFSSGLLAPNQGMPNSRAHTPPPPPSSPMMIPTTPGDPIDRSLTATPTQQLSSNAMLISPGPSSSNSSLNNMETETQPQPRPRLRKRRSSLSVTVSPMSNIKSPGRSAGHALQRTGLMSPSRMRSGSVSEFGMGMAVASEDNSLAGRMRSVNTGVALRSRRVIRKPSGPAPTAPLPAIPAIPTITTTSPISPYLPLAEPIPRRPLTHRLHSAENTHSPQHNYPNSDNNTPTSPTPTQLTATNPAFNTKRGVGQGLGTPVVTTSSALSPETDLGAPFQYQQYQYQQKIDEMKEN